MLITKSEDVTKQGFCKYSEENSVFGRVSYYLLLEFLWEGVGWGARLFEAGRLSTFSAFRMDAYWRWALIRGWALNRINTVNGKHNTAFRARKVTGTFEKQVPGATFSEMPGTFSGL